MNHSNKRPTSKTKSKEQRKEDGWNDRFYLGKIPHYGTNQGSNYNQIPPIKKPYDSSTSTPLNYQGIKPQGYNYNRTLSAQGQGRYKLATANYPPINLANQSREMPHVYDQNIEKEEAFAEEFSLIQNLWDDLGVNEDYKDLFEEEARRLEGKARKEFLDLENQCLKRFRDSLIKLSKEIQNREKAVKALIQYDESFKADINNSSNNKINGTVLNEIIQTIKSIRIHSVNIVNHMTKIREICCYSASNGKYIMERVNKLYNYDKYYLLKMRNDFDFLYKSPLCNYFNFSQEPDPFFLNLVKEDEGSDSYRNTNYVPVNEDMMIAIKSSEFVIKQDMIFYQLYNSMERGGMGGTNYIGKSLGSHRNGSACRRSNDTPKRSNGNMSQFLHQLRMGPNYNQLFLYRNIELKESNDINSQQLKGKKSKINIIREEIPFMSRNELLERIEEYEKLKKKEDNKDDDTNEKKKKEEERILKQKEKEKKEKEEEEKRKQDKIRKEKEEEEREKRRQERVQKDIAKKEKEKKEKEKKEKEEKEKEEKEKEEERRKQEEEDKLIMLDDVIKEDDDIEDNDNKEKERLERERLEKEQKEEEEKIRNRIEEEDRLAARLEEERIQMEEEEYQRQQQKIQEEEERIRREKEEEERIIREKEEERIKREKEEEERIRKEKEEEERIKIEKEEEERLKIEKEDEEYAKIQKILEEEEEKERQKLLEEDNKDNEFDQPYSNTSSDFHVLSFYSNSLTSLLANESYFSSIKEDHKQTFKSSNNPFNFTKGLNPRILVAYSDPQQTNIIGICQYGYKSFTSPSLQLTINHISTIHPNWELIMTSFINFIQSNIPFDEIEMTLYYLFKDHEVVVNKEVMSLFKDKLQFKWLCIENMANSERSQMIVYQKPQNAAKIPAPTLLSISNSSLITLTSTPFEPKIPFDKYLNIFNLTCLLNLLKSDGYTLSTTAQNKEQLINWKIPTMKTDMNGIFTSYMGSVADCTIPQYDPYKVSIKNFNNKAYSCTINYTPKLMSNITCSYNDYIYNRIEGNIGILNEKKLKQKFYLIPSEDNQNSIFVCEMTPELKDFLVNNGNNITELFYEYYNGFDTMDDKTMTSTLWIPSFYINSHLVADKVAYLEEVAICNDDDKMFIETIDEYISVGYAYDNGFKEGFDVQPKENDIVIKNNFLFGLINVEVLKKMNLPAITMNMVTKDYWVKNALKDIR